MNYGFSQTVNFKRFVQAALVSAALLAALLLPSCAKPASGAADPALVAGLTGGIIERSDPVEVEFTVEFDTEKPIPPGVFKLDPAAGGELSWKNPFTLVFNPASPLEPGKEYTARVDPSGLSVLGDAPAPLQPFSFTFETALPRLDVALDPVRITEDGMVLITGRVIAGAGAPAEKIERALSSRELGKPQWAHENGEHRFSFPPLKQGPASRTAALNWDGKILGSKDEGFLSVLIPGNARFELIGFSMENDIVLAAFSAPLKQNQDLRGFISLSGNTEVRYSLNGNILRIFGGRGNAGGVGAGTVVTLQDIPALDGRVLAEPAEYVVPGRWELPELRFTGTGTILPSSQGTSMVIETRNLSGLLVEAFRIYGDNMVQFLQVNSLGETRELERVGEPLWTRAFDLPWKDSDRNNWKRHGLDLSELARKYPGDMFHLRMSFRPRHVKYQGGPEEGEDFSGIEFPGDEFPAFGNHGEGSYWDWYQENRYEWYDSRMNPRHPAFYLNFYDHNITVGRNVLISDLGLLAKKSMDGSWMAAAVDVKTAGVLPGVDIEVLNYQGRSLYQLKTGPDGMVLFGAGSPVPLDGGLGNKLPYFLTARSGGLGRAYLKLDNSQALTVSHFDISGERPVSGLRGLIYGERGVWRPGDDIYLTFLLSDPLGTLPASHPVSFELEDPRGRIGRQQTLTSSVDGFYPFTVSTAADAPTGNWTARVKVGGSVFAKTVKVETVIPNRLKMNLDFKGAGSFAVRGGERPFIGRETAVSLEASWLYGAPAPGLKSDLSVSFADTAAGFSEYGDYSFRDPSRSVSGERQTVWTGTLDDRGRADFTLKLNPGDKAPGRLSARFMTRVFESSGAFSTEQSAVEFSPYDRYVGLRLPRGDAARNMLLTDTEHRADIVLVGGDGKPLGGRTELECALYKLQWRWWWEKGGEEAAEFASALSRKPVAEGKVSADNGRAVWNFQVKYPEWGRYMAVVRDPQGGHAAASELYIDWPGWAGRSTEGQGAAAMLVLTPEKIGYAAGEKAAVSFPSNSAAAALVVIEKSGGVLRKEWISCTDTLTRYEFTADPSMVPNVYVHVTLLQPHLQTKNDLPLRLYGITPVMVEDPRTQLSPRIAVKGNWEPETQVSFSVNEASGRPMAYTVAVVDEGLLGLTRFSLPNPRNTFYSREASFLKSWDIFADFMGAYSGQLETLLAIGGSDDGTLDSDKETRRFKPVVRFFGPYEIARGETKTETFTLPPYIGSLRIMVLAASSSGEYKVSAGGNQGVPARAYGTAEKSVIVSSDLMVFAAVPRMLSPGDEAEIPVTAALYKEGNRTVELTLSAAGAVLSGPGRQTLSFNGSGEKTARFRIKAPNLPGALRITVTASSPGIKTAREITDLSLRTTALPVTVSQVKLLSPGEAWNGTIAFPGREGTNAASAEFSRLPPLNLEGRLHYLISYPHGCLEQTTSAAFPQLYLDKVLALDAKQLAGIRTNIAAAVDRLAQFQISGGGFSYWPGGESAHDWSSSYAGHFLIEAKRAGYAVPQDMLNKFTAFQKNRTAAWSSSSGENQAEQAYRLYTLALAGEADLGSMNRLRERKDTKPDALWRLAAAYWYAGQRDTARNLVNSLDTRPVQEQYRELSGTFGSALRDKAIILETLVLLGDTGRAKALFEETARALAGEAWLSTQETACALMAVIPYMRGAAGQDTAQGAARMSAELSFGGETRSLSFSTQLAQAELGSPRGTSSSFSVRNSSPAPLYARIALRGLPEEGKEPPLSRGLTLAVEYRNERGEAVDPGSVKQGEDMEIRVAVRNTSLTDLREVALVHALPASWELINQRPGPEEGGSSAFKYQDLRDDRVMTYFDLNRGASLSVVLRVNKTYGGSYLRPSIQAYAMYDESIRAVIPGVPGPD